MGDAGLPRAVHCSRELSPGTSLSGSFSAARVAVLVCCAAGCHVTGPVRKAASATPSGRSSAPATSRSERKSADADVAGTRCLVPLIAVRAVERAVVPGMAGLLVGPRHQGHRVWSRATAQYLLERRGPRDQDQAPGVLYRPAVAHRVVEELRWIGDFHPDIDEQAEPAGRQFSSP